jgi:hypothetical protein
MFPVGCSSLTSFFETPPQSNRRLYTGSHRPTLSSSIPRQSTEATSPTPTPVPTRSIAGNPYRFLALQHRLLFAGESRHFTKPREFGRQVSRQRLPSPAPFAFLLGWCGWTRRLRCGAPAGRCCRPCCWRRCSWASSSGAPSTSSTGARTRAASSSTSCVKCKI